MAGSPIPLVMDKSPPGSTVQVSDSHNSEKGPPSDCPKNLKYTCAVANAQNERDEMEDSHALIAPFGRVPGEGFFAVYDGHGGKYVADLCGREFHEYFRNVMERNPTLPIRDILCRTFLDLNNKIFEVAEANKDCSDDPGSTAVIAFLGVKSNGADEGGMRAQVLDTIEPINPGSHRVLHCANVGDSRGVICRGGEAFRVSCDHDIKSNEAEKDRVQALKTPEEEKIIWNDRILGDLEVTRSLGDHYYKDWVTADPCTYEMELDDEDEFIILASDGLWKEVDDQKAVNHVRYTRDPKKAAENLVKLALETPSRDNITVIVIRLRGFASE